MTLGNVYQRGHYSHDHEIVWPEPEEWWLRKHGAVVLHATCDYTNYPYTCNQPVSIGPIHQNPTRTRQNRERIGSAAWAMWLRHWDVCQPRQTAVKSARLSVQWAREEGDQEWLSKAREQLLKESSAWRMSSWRVTSYASGEAWVAYEGGEPCVRSSRTSKRRRLCPGSGELAFPAEVVRRSWCRDGTGGIRFDFQSCTGAFSCGACYRYDIQVIYRDGETEPRWAEHFEEAK